MDSTGYTRSASPRSFAREGGFSFIEILVVMGIIGVLVGGVLIAVNLVFENKPRWETERRLVEINTQIENWGTHYEALPPTELARLPALVSWLAAAAMPEVVPPNAINDGNECVYQALLQPGAPTAPPEEATGNDDGDTLRRSINRRGTRTLTEMQDGYGRPFVYMHSADYARHADAGLRYTSRDERGDLIEVTARPHRRADGTFRHAAGFQLFSMGADGVPNTQDDITVWD